MRLGTRGSALALAQAQPVATALDAELVVIKTSGDLGTRQGDKERWVDGIEQALLDGSIDAAVHSAKDVPGELADGLAIVAAAGRADPSDALIGAPSLDDLPAGARVGTSSPRRRAQLLSYRPDLEVIEITGNVDTRLAKLARGEVDAMVLASAGLKRLGRGDEIGAALDPARFVPAPGQGTLAIEARPGLDVARIADAEALASLTAERRLAELLGATCNSAVGIYHDGEVLHAWVGAVDGSRSILDSLAGSAEKLDARLTSVGARELIV